MAVSLTIGAAVGDHSGDAYSGGGSILKDKRLPPFFVARLDRLARLGYDAEWLAFSLKEMYPRMKKAGDLTFIVALAKEFDIHIVTYPKGSIAHRDYRWKGNGAVRAETDRFGRPRKIIDEDDQPTEADRRRAAHESDLRCSYKIRQREKAKQDAA